MNWLAETALLSHGWRRAVLLLAAGAISALALPPFFVVPALFVGFPVWVWCLDGAEDARGWGRVFGPAFSIGFWFGLGYFLVAIHWTGAAFFVDGGWMLLLMPLAVLALAIVLAIFWGLASSLANIFWSSSPWRLLALTAPLTLAEFARGHLLSGFPFDLVGYALTPNPETMQITAFVGIYGLTFATIGLAVLPALIWPADDRRLFPRYFPVAVIAVVLAAGLAFGAFRIANTAITERPDLEFRLVQPSIAQSVKWQAGSREFVMERLFSLSEAKLGPDDKGLEGVTALVWPESAMPFYLADQPADLARIARMLPDGKFLITGAPRRNSAPDEPEAAFNSILVIDSDGAIAQSYDKTHLVPVGEYLPFGDFFRTLGIGQFVSGASGWTAGTIRQPLDLANLVSFLPLICYEAIFSGDLGTASGKSGFLLNLTNDGWFDGSIGPAQHFHHARLRAVEEGQSLVRVANTGVTALVDPFGRVVASLSPQSVALLDVSPPAPLPGTPFQRWRHWPLLIVLLLSAAILGTQKLRTRKHGAVPAFTRRKGT